MMRLIYDGSFEGFLTGVFELYERKSESGRIVRDSLYQPMLQEEILTILQRLRKQNASGQD